MIKKEIVLGVVFLLLAGFLFSLVCAEKLDIEVENNYVPGDAIKFKVFLYDDNNVKIDSKVDYVIQNYYKDMIEEGSVGSGEEVVFDLPESAVQGPWKIIASYEDIELNRLFNVGELKKAEIKLDGDVLVIKNVGNVVYDKKILIYIGSADQTADVFLEIGQTKKIRLTAPDGDYNIRIIEGNEENVLQFDGVKLTGNVIINGKPQFGLESILGDSFWKKYPLVSLFLGVILLIVVIVGILKFINQDK